MSIQSYIYTNRGGRDENQDFADMYQDGANNIFVLADGLGGHKDGEQASQLVVSSIIEAYALFSKKNGKKGTQWDEWLREQIMLANDKILDAQEKQKTDMKSTVISLTVCDDHAFWASVGDSRLYYLNGGMISQLSKDHSVSFKKYLSGDILKDMINFDEDRSSLLRVVGDETRCAPESGILQGMGNHRTAFLLCSDGFWQYLYDEEILFEYLKADSPKEWIDHMLLRMLPRIQPDSDNLTCIAVFAE